MAKQGSIKSRRRKYALVLDLAPVIDPVTGKKKRRQQ
jgi:hypothetical protein